MTTSTTAPIDAEGTRRAWSASRGLITVVAALVLLVAAGFVFAPSSVSPGAIQSACCRSRRYWRSSHSARPWWSCRGASTSRWRARSRS